MQLVGFQNEEKRGDIFRNVDRIDMIDLRKATVKSEHRKSWNNIVESLENGGRSCIGNRKESQWNGGELQTVMKFSMKKLRRREIIHSCIDLFSYV